MSRYISVSLEESLDPPHASVLGTTVFVDNFHLAAARAMFLNSVIADIRKADGAIALIMLPLFASFGHVLVGPRFVLVLSCLPHASVSELR